MARTSKGTAVEERQRAEIRRLRAELRTLKAAYAKSVELLTESVSQGAAAVLMFNELEGRFRDLEGEHEATLRDEAERDDAASLATKTAKVREGVRQTKELLQDAQLDEKIASFYITRFSELDDRLWNIVPKSLVQTVRIAREDRRYTAATVFAELCEATGALDFTPGKALGSIKAIMNGPESNSKGRAPKT